MWETFFATLSPMMVMLICIVIGVVLNKAHILSPNAGTILSRLVTYVLSPALTINTFMTYCTPASFASQYPVILYGVLGVAVTILLGTVLCRFFSRDAYIRSIYRYSLSIANFGFLGNSVVPQILGEAALYPYMLFTMPMSMMVYSWGIQILIPKGGERKSMWRNLLNPIFVAMIIGIVLGLTNAGAVMPEFAKLTLKNLGSSMAPLAMILTGFIIGDYDFMSLLKMPGVYAATALRLFVFPLLFVGLFWLVGAGKDVLIMAMFAYGTALGLNVVVIPAAYGGDTRTGAAMAMISHLGCIVSIPLLYALLTSIL